MLWLRFPPQMDVPTMIEQVGKRLGSLSELEDNHVDKYVLAHVVYSTNRYPRVMVHDVSDTFYSPVGVEGLSVSIPYLLPKILVNEIIASMRPVSQPGPRRHKTKEEFDDDEED